MAKKTVKKVKPKKVALPKVHKSNRSLEGDNFPLAYYSASSLTKLCTNPILWKIRYLNNDVIDSTESPVFFLGKAFHHAMQVYNGGSDEIIVSDENEAIQEGLKAGLDYIEKYPDGLVNYNDSIKNRQVVADKFAFMFNTYVKEMPYHDSEIVMMEEKLESRVSIEWRGEKLTLPVPLVGAPDKVVRSENKLKIVDYKTCKTFSKPDKIDARKIIQAIMYYFLVAVETEEVPYSMVYEEIKHTKSRDGKQIQVYEIVYEENEQFFDFFFRLYDDVTRSLLGEMVYLPNIDAFFDNEIAILAYIHRLDVPEERAAQMKAERVDNITDLLKKKIHNAGNMKRLLKTVEEQFISAKNIDYSKMQNEEKIAMKLAEHGMAVQFDSVVNGASVDQYRYVPSVGLKMSRVRQYADDVEQVLGKSGVRVLAPIPNTSFIGFEVPRKDRVFPHLPSKKDGYNLAIGQDVMGEHYRYNITEAPHMLVAGATGSGKSVFLNALITQLNRLRKDQSEIHLIDPKMVELAPYADEKNVATYVTDIEEIEKHLTMLTDEMDNRYKTLRSMKKRSVYDGTDITPIFVFVDEFGDLIAQNHKVSVIDEAGKVKEHNVSRSIERLVLRLAQKARAAGIHLIISTQRPSVDVITGTIKANFPTKVAFRTSKVIDSHVVIDEDGAEKLLGKGDLLFAPNGGEIIRLQGYNV